jgi:hypothetical protein
MILDPSKIVQLQEKKEELQEEKRQQLLNEDIIEMKDRKRFDRRERSIHTEIPPAAIRMQGMKKRDISAKFDDRVQESLKKRPMTGVPAGGRTGSNLANMSQAEMTTQAQSVFEETEGAIS